MNKTDEAINALQAKRQRVATAETEFNRLEGRRQGIFDNLATRFKVTTVAEGERKLKQLSAAIDSNEAKLQAGEAKLEQDYDWS